MAGEDTAQASDEVNVDELLAEAEKPTPERAMTGGEEAPAAAQPPSWDGKQWEFDWNGKKIFPDSQDKAKTWMSQGYNYSQRMGEFNRTKAQWEQQQQAAQRAAQEFQQKLSPYQKVDDYARKNPQWWQHVIQQFETAQKGQPGQQQDPRLQALEQQVGQFSQQFEQLQQERLVQHQQREDQALGTEVEAIRKEFPNIDLAAVDPESGKTLENRILEHASTMFGHLPEYKAGVFRAAFRDYLHDKLIEQARASSREAVAQNAKADAKKGVLGRSPAPVKAVQPTSVKGKSYNDLAGEALRELGLAK